MVGVVVGPIPSVTENEVVNIGRYHRYTRLYVWIRTVNSLPLEASQIGARNVNGNFHVMLGDRTVGNIAEGGFSKLMVA